ncbi:NAD(P)-binding domain-containing protein [Microbacterium invictum]|uniref:3-hydroxyisobutyrate dehydrogenase n=1 Tax=Microbacterium invictum TaxID=515415 RepID=A0AA40VNY0_9MICO|nr:NAD(P)-dependent oxidoreductase [Microbacterium invictum]MBB4141259.1 3-hydroxyisobutyrate dehydrogenase [Microbacterium invictum]
MRVGFIGLGQMGRGMAANLLAAGHELVVTDIAPHAATELLAHGASWAATAEELARSVEVVFTSLPTPADVEDVAASLESGLGEGTAWFDLSTNSVDTVRSLAARLAEREVAFLDAPVSGGPNGAATGRLAIWVGGDRVAFDRHLELLQAIADKPAYIGPIGAGTIAKLVHNMTSLGISAVLGEMMTVGVKAGLEPLALFEAIRSGAAGRARSFDKFGNRVLSGDLDTPSFQLRLAYKDAGLAVRLAREFEVPTALCDIIYDEMTEAMDRGWGGRDSQAFLQLQQERAGVPPLQVDPADLAAVFDRT